MPPTSAVNVLVELFGTTDGARGNGGWTDSTNWLTGEPCVNGWHGVVCCPSDYPRYRDGECRRADGVDDDGSRVPTTTSPGGAPAPWPNGCASGLSTGTSQDNAKCTIVALELASNNLDGELPASLCTLLPDLRKLDVRGNKLKGRLPECVTSFDEVSFDDNEFDYIESDPTLRELIERCRTSGDASCSGVPPLSCDAFGDHFEVRSEDSERCVACPELGVSLTLQLGVLALFVLIVWGYVKMVEHYEGLGERLDLWINTAAIFFCHLQTLSIIGTLKLAWPQSVRTLTQVVTVDFLSLGAVRPECAIRVANSFYFFTYLRILLLLLLTGGVSVAQSALKACAPATRMRQTIRRVDQLEMIETVLFTFGLTFSWRIIFDLWEQGSSSISVAKGGAALASILFVVQLALLAKYALNIRALVTGKQFGRVANLSNERLQLRLSFLTERFAGHAPYWQYMVWLRQFLLTLDVFIAQSIIDTRDDILDGVVVCRVENGTDVSGVVDGDVEGGNRTADFCQPLSQTSLDAIWTHVVFAVLIFLVFWAAQLRVTPYAYSFQNRIESSLFAVNLIVVCLGAVYSSLKYHQSPTDSDNVGLEVVCMKLLVCSLIAAVAFMGVHSYREHMKRRQERELGDRAAGAGVPPSLRPSPLQLSKSGSSCGSSGQIQAPSTLRRVVCNMANRRSMEEETEAEREDTISTPRELERAMHNLRGGDDPSPRGGAAALERALKANHHASDQRPSSHGSRPSSSSSTPRTPAAGVNRRSSWQFSALIDPSRPMSSKRGSSQRSKSSKRSPTDRSSNDGASYLSDRDGCHSPNGTGRHFQTDGPGAISLSPMGSGVSSAALSLSDAGWSTGPDGSGCGSGIGESGDAVDTTELSRSSKPRKPSAISARERLSNRLSEVTRPKRASQGPGSPNGMPPSSPQRFVHDLGPGSRPPRLPDVPRPNIRLEHDPTPNRLPIDPRSIPI